MSESQPGSVTFVVTNTDEQWQQVRAIRQRVFVEEQNCPPEEEWDAFDETSHHILGTLDGVPIAAARWRQISDRAGRSAKVERFAVLPEGRGRGLGRELIAFTLADTTAAGHRRVMLHAQAHLENLYASFGFVTKGARFMEAGIPHVEMVLER